MSVSQEFIDRLQNELDSLLVYRQNLLDNVATFDGNIADLQAALADLRPEEVEADEPAAEQPAPVVEAPVGESSEPEPAEPESGTAVPETPEPAAEPEADPAADAPAAQDGYVDDDGDEYAWTDSDEPDEGTRTEQ